MWNGSVEPRNKFQNQHVSLFYSNCNSEREGQKNSEYDPQTHCLFPVITQNTVLHLNRLPSACVADMVMAT